MYVVSAIVDGITFKGMMNIGFRPTITDAHVRSIEVHLFDFDKDIYNHTIKIEMRDRLRDEKKFENVEALIEQLKKDKEAADLVILE